MILQFLEKIPNVPAIGIPPLHIPHLGCKHAECTRQKNNQNQTKEEAQTIHKYQANLRVHRKNSKQSQNYTLSETEWIRMHQNDKKLVINNILNAQSQREKDQSKNILTQFYLVSSGQDPILCCTTTKAHPPQTCATAQGNANLLSVKNYLKISKIIY